MIVLSFFLGFIFWAFVTAGARKGADTKAEQLRTQEATLSAREARLAEADEALRRREDALREQQAAVDRATVAVQASWRALETARLAPIVDIPAEHIIDLTEVCDRSGYPRKGLV